MNAPHTPSTFPPSDLAENSVNPAEPADKTAPSADPLTTGPHQNPDAISRETDTTGPHQGE